MTHRTLCCAAAALLVASFGVVGGCSSQSPGGGGHHADGGSAGQDPSGSVGSGGSGGSVMPACGGDGQPCCNGTQCNAGGLVCLGGACTSSEAGKTCSHNGDCQSGICLPVGDGRNVCTTACGGPGDCVAGWSCNPLTGQPSNICQCQSAPEKCDGADNDCNGVVDDESQADQSCGALHVCSGGSCTCAAANLCGSACLDLSSDTKNCGSCGNACAQGASCAGSQCTCPGSPVVCGGECAAVSSTFHVCNGTCASNTDVATCGTSCTPCPTTAHGTATCNGQGCGFNCSSGYVQCASGCCENCMTAGCSGLTWCDASSGLCKPGCAHHSQCPSGDFCDVTTHSCIVTVDDSCPSGYTYNGMCSNGIDFCTSSALPSGTQFVFVSPCPAGTSERGDWYCSDVTRICVPDN